MELQATQSTIQNNFKVEPKKLNGFIAALKQKGLKYEVDIDPNTDFKKIGFATGRGN